MKVKVKKKDQTESAEFSHIFWADFKEKNLELWGKNGNIVEMVNINQRKLFTFS